MFQHRVYIQGAVLGSVEVFAAVLMIFIISRPYLPREFPVKPTTIHGVSSLIPGPCFKACRGNLVLITSCFSPSLWRDALTSSLSALRHGMGSHTQPRVSSFSYLMLWEDCLLFTRWTILPDMSNARERGGRKH